MRRDRYIRLDRIQALRPERDYEEIHRLSTLYEFPFDHALGLQLAYYRSFGIPRISALLAGTGHILADPVKRAEDTGLMMVEMIEHGLDHDRSRTVLRKINGLHRPHLIGNDDFLYILGTFMIVPTRWIDRYGWRRISESERAAVYHFYRAVGERMNVADIPPDFDSYAAWFDAFEAEHFAFTPVNRQLLDASQELLVHRFPGWAEPLARRLGAALLDERLRDALGVPRPRWLVRMATHVGFRLRAKVIRYTMTARPESAFTPGGVMRTYPDGYDIAELGPPDRGESR